MWGGSFHRSWFALGICANAFFVFLKVKLSTGIDWIILSVGRSVQLWLGACHIFLFFWGCSEDSSTGPAPPVFCRARGVGSCMRALRFPSSHCHLETWGLSWTCNMGQCSSHMASLPWLNVSHIGWTWTWCSAKGRWVLSQVVEAGWVRPASGTCPLLSQVLLQCTWGAGSVWRCSWFPPCSLHWENKKKSGENESSESCATSSAFPYLNDWRHQNMLQSLPVPPFIDVFALWWLYRVLKILPNCTFVASYVSTLQLDPLKREAAWSCFS